MKESVGGAQILLIIVAIIIIMMLVLTGSISYSKAFKARNAIVNIVQKYARTGETAAGILERGAATEISDIFNKIGYMKTINSNRGCCIDATNGHAASPSSSTCQLDNYSSDTLDTDVAQGKDYNYCIYHYVDKVNNVEYYGVQTYMYFEIPLFGRTDRFAFPIYADTYSIRGVETNL